MFKIFVLSCLYFIIGVGLCLLGLKLKWLDEDTNKEEVALYVFFWPLMFLVILWALIVDGVSILVMILGNMLGIIDGNEIRSKNTHHNRRR